LSESERDHPHGGPQRRRAAPSGESGRQAKRAVSDIIDRFGPWRASVARMLVQSDRMCSAAERVSLEKECEQLETAVRIARLEVLDRLIEAPHKVVSDSRIVDVERGLDSLELSLANCRARLAEVTSRAAISSKRREPAAL